jgi:hypothetical protein
MGSWAERIVCSWVNSSFGYNASMYGISDGRAFSPGQEFLDFYTQHRDREGEGAKRPDVMVWMADDPVAAIEVKFSDQRSLDRSLNVVIKSEEIDPLVRWWSENSTPLLVSQLFPDAMYVMSFPRFLWCIRNYHLSGASERYNRETGKSAHYVPLKNAQRIGSIEESHLRVDHGGDWPSILDKAR